MLFCGHVGTLRDECCLSLVHGSVLLKNLYAVVVSFVLFLLLPLLPFVHKHFHQNHYLRVRRKISRYQKHTGITLWSESGRATGNAT